MSIVNSAQFNAGIDNTQLRDKIGAKYCRFDQVNRQLVMISDDPKSEKKCRTLELIHFKFIEKQVNKN